MPRSSRHPITSSRRPQSSAGSMPGPTHAGLSPRATARPSATGPFGWWLQYFWGITLILIAMLAWDWFRHKRVMRPVVLGAAVLWGGQVATTVLNFTPAWKSLMVELVRAWGYTG